MTNTSLLAFNKANEQLHHRLLAVKSKSLCCGFSLTQSVWGSQGAGSGLLVGLRVAGGQRFSHGCSGEIGVAAGPAQGELQGGTLGETLKWRQTLQKESRSLNHASLKITYY